MKYTVKQPKTLLDFLCDVTGAKTKTRMRQIIKSGSVKVDGAEQKRTDVELQPGQTVEMVSKEANKKYNAPFPLLYEDQYLLAAVKPAGLLSVTTENEKENTFYKIVSNYVKEETKDRGKIFIVHRLDRDVSGIMLFAKSEQIQEALQENWQENEKLYVALVEGHPPHNQGTIQNWLKENRAQKVYETVEGPHAKFCTTHYRILKKFPKHSLLEINLETGRKNQIRAHMEGLGTPIVGDKKYSALTNPIRRLGLHAYKLTFTHPVTGERIQLENAVPKVFFQFAKEGRK